ncbi:AAA family ATPase [Mycoplasma procyoni]|uniref:AAA family ATPase n=1 Tax=Mycoplasma procyoni TaxID=568784 RepID=UPI00280AA60A|nr:AAA family ATPase [Mycoplasma procyoni]
MAFYHSIEQFKYKINHKNILIISGNINDYLYIKDIKKYLEDPYLTENDIFKDEIDTVAPRNIISVVQLLSLYLKAEKYDNITYLSPGFNSFDLTKNLDQQLLLEEQDDDDDDDFGDSNTANNSHPDAFIQRLIETINKLKKTLDDTSINKPKSYAFIINLSDFVFKDFPKVQAANLISAFNDLGNLSRNKVFNSKFKLILLCDNKELVSELLGTKNVEMTNLVIKTPSSQERKNFIIENILSDLNSNLEEKIIENSSDLNNMVSILNDFSFREIIQLSKVSRIQKFKNFEELHRIVFRQKKESEWEKIDSNKMKSFKETMKQRIKGQDFAIDQLHQALIRSYIGLNDIGSSFKLSKKPKGIMFFAGPTGTGKTETVKALTEFVFGDESSMIRFDMSEYNLEHSDEKLIGSPPGYVGHESGGQLTNAIKEKPFSIVLFDEIEKAHGKVLDKFLQILEDGRLTSSKGEIIDFSETFIIFTSNIGVSEVNELKDIKDKDLVRKTFKDEVRKFFTRELKRPEILNRIGEKNIVPFNFITKDTKEDKEILFAILDSKFVNLQRYFSEEKRISIQFDSDEDRKQYYNVIINYFKPKYGARGLISTFETKLIDPLAQFVFENWTTIQTNKANNASNVIIIKTVQDENTNENSLTFDLK